MLSYQWAFEFETVAFNCNDGDSGGKVAIINQINRFSFFTLGNLSGVEIHTFFNGVIYIRGKTVDFWKIHSLRIIHQKWYGNCVIYLSVVMGFWGFFEF
jgi:hypothetical protein